MTFVGALGCTALDPANDTAVKVLGVGGDIAEGGGGSATPDDGGGGTPAEWACLDDAPQPFSNMVDRVQYIVAIVDFDSQPAPVGPSVIDGLTITVCGSPSCSPPYSAPEVVAQQIDPTRPYLWMIDFPYNFSNGYLQLRAPGYAPMHYVFGGPMKGMPDGSTMVYGLTIPLLKESTRDTIYNDLGLPGPADPTRGVLAVRTLKCGRNDTGQGVRAAGVRLQAIPEAPEAPAVAWTLSFSNRATPNKLETDDRGVAGFVNVVPGSVDVEGIAPIGAQGRAYGATTLPVRAGVITLGEVRYGLDLWGQ